MYTKLFLLSASGWGMYRRRHQLFIVVRLLPFQSTVLIVVIVVATEETRNSVIAVTGPVATSTRFSRQMKSPVLVRINSYRSTVSRSVNDIMVKEEINIVNKYLKTAFAAKFVLCF
jgi:hypothetical protein